MRTSLSIQRSSNEYFSESLESVFRIPWHGHRQRDPLEQAALRPAESAEGMFSQNQERIMSIGLLLLIVLAIFLVGAIPTWSYSSGWGYAPSGTLVLLVVVLVLLLLGRL